MLRRIGVLTRNFVTLIFVVALAVGLALLVWFSVQADDLPATASLDQPSTHAVVAPPGSIQSSQFVTPAVFLPMVVRDFPPLPVFGIEMFKVNNSGGLQQTLQAGVHWVHLAAFDWDRIQPARYDAYNWGEVDEASLINAAKNGLEVIATIRFAPTWAQKYDGHYCGPFKRDTFGDFAEFLKALVARYSMPPYNVHYWEIGNEPDIDHTQIGGHNIYGCWGEYDDDYYGGGYYAEMLKVAYPAIKSADPKAQVMIGGLLLDCDPRDLYACAGGSHGDKPSKFLEGILRNGGGPYFDIASFHAYSYWGGVLGDMGNAGWPGSATTIPEKVGFIREVLQKYEQGDKRLMNTEAALKCKEAWPDCFETQAVYMPRAYAEAMATGLEAQSYFAISSEHWWHSGLLYPDLSPKPAYYAYQTAARFLGTAKYREEAMSYPAGIEGYIFDRPTGGSIDVVWTHDGSVQTMVLPAGATAYDRYGAQVPVVGSGIQVDYSPVYVVRP